MCGVQRGSTRADEAVWKGLRWDLSDLAQLEPAAQDRPLENQKPSGCVIFDESLIVEEKKALYKPGIAGAAWVKEITVTLVSPVRVRELGLTSWKVITESFF